jgi:hypothetical protein
MDAAGTNKSITRQELQTYNAGTLTTDVKVLDLSATWDNSGVTFTGLKFQVTNTASNSASLVLDLQVGTTSIFQVRAGGNAAINGSLYGGNTVTAATWGITGAGFFAVSTRSFGWSSSGTFDFSTGTVDLRLERDAAASLAQRNGTNAQTFRLYNTFTDASNYERLGINWGSNIVSIAPEAAGTGTVRVLHISGLPTSNPGAGILWNDSNTVKVGT